MFWLLYKDMVIKTGVKYDKVEWYVHWVEKFVKSMKGKPLRLWDRQDKESGVIIHAQNRTI